MDAQFNNPNNEPADNQNYDNPQAENEFLNKEQTSFTGNGDFEQKQAGQVNQSNSQTTFAGDTAYNNAQTEFADQKYAAQKYVSYLPYGFTPKTFEEKKGIRKAALITGLSVLILMGVSFFWATAYFFVMGRLGIDYNRALEIVSDPAVITRDLVYRR